MGKPIPHAGFMNISWFRVVYFESVVWSVLIDFLCKFQVEREDIVHKMRGKFGDVLSFSFSTQKFPPRYKQIFHGDDIIKFMAQPFNSLSLSRETPLFWVVSKRDICCGWILSRIFRGARDIPSARGLKINSLHQVVSFLLDTTQILSAKP